MWSVPTTDRYSAVKRNEVTMTHRQAWKTSCQEKKPDTKGQTSDGCMT